MLTRTTMVSLSLVFVLGPGFGQAETRTAPPHSEGPGAAPAERQEEPGALRRGIPPIAPGPGDLDVPDLDSAPDTEDVPELDPEELAEVAAADARSEAGTTLRAEIGPRIAEAREEAQLAQENAQQDQERAREKAERERERADREKERGEHEKERAEQQRQGEEDKYDSGSEALDEGRWDRAIHIFDELVRMKGRRADAALYWKAYAQNKRGQRPEALATIAELRKAYPDSRWVGEAKSLEAEVRRTSGQPPAPETVGDEDEKLLVLNGLLQSGSPEQAVPMLEKLLQGNASPKVKDRALFVLCQSGSPRAREVAAAFARGANPALQMKAIKYLGLFGGAESLQTLSDIYASSADMDVKKAVLRSFMVAGAKDRVFAAAKSESSPELRREAIRQLGVMGAQTEVWELYRNESSPDLKKAMIEALFIGGSAERLIELSRTEKEPTLRRAAIQKLGLMGGSRTSEALVALYASDKDRDVREEVLQAFFLQGNAKALIEVARKETDPALRKRAVEKLSLIGSKESIDFLMELLNK